MRIVGTFTALALLTLSGCTDEKDAVLPSVISTRSATSASPTPTAVGGRAGVPDEAKKHTRAGAQAFARYYVELVNIAWLKPDPTVFEGLGDPECVFCKNMTSYAKKLESKGQRFDAPVIRLRSLSKFNVEPRDDEEWFLATIEQQRADIVDSRGTVVDTQKKKTLQRVVLILWQHEEWYFGDTDKVTA